MEAAVWECDDLRRYIFSFLRTKPTLICGQCNAVCVWDKEVRPHIFFLDHHLCVECWGRNHPCRIV